MCASTTTWSKSGPWPARLTPSTSCLAPCDGTPALTRSRPSPGASSKCEADEFRANQRAAGVAPPRPYSDEGIPVPSRGDPLARPPAPPDACLLAQFLAHDRRALGQCLQLHLRDDTG